MERGKENKWEKAVSARVVDGDGHPQGIAQRFADKYQDLYNKIACLLMLKRWRILRNL
jgi:hypothetical protein